MKMRSTGDTALGIQHDKRSSDNDRRNRLRLHRAYDVLAIL